MGSGLGFLALGLFALSGFAAPERSAPQPGAHAPERVNALEGEYVLTELNRQPIATPAARPAPTPPGAPPNRAAPPAPLPKGARVVGSAPTLIFDGGARVGGSTGCNRLNTSINLSAQFNRPFFTPIATTKMACLERGAMQLETDYLNALRRATRMDLTGRKITLFGPNGARLAVLNSVSARAQAGGLSLYGKTWVLRSINGQVVRLDNPPTIRFEGKDVTGNAGCNGFQGFHERVAGQSRFSRLLATQMACAESERRALESAYLNALPKVTQISLTQNQLVMTAQDGRTRLVFEEE